MIVTCFAPAMQVIDHARHVTGFGLHTAFDEQFVQCVDQIDVFPISEIVWKINGAQFWSGHANVVEIAIEVGIDHLVGDHHKLFVHMGMCKHRNRTCPEPNTTPRIAGEKQVTIIETIS